MINKNKSKPRKIKNQQILVINKEREIEKKKNGFEVIPAQTESRELFFSKYIPFSSLGGQNEDRAMSFVRFNGKPKI